MSEIFDRPNEYLNEIRDCEIGEDGKVVRVIPKEGE